MFPDITGALKSAMPDLRGKLEANAPTAPLSWFRTGGPAQVLYSPDRHRRPCRIFLPRLDPDIPVLVGRTGLEPPDP